MSGIYIPGMKMPKCCYDCELIDIVTSCPHYDLPSEAYCQIDYIRKRRDKDCPLVSVPDHGRLVDADRLKRNIYANLPVAVQDLCPGFCNIVDMQKTVIPAEEESESWKHF